MSFDRPVSPIQDDDRPIYVIDTNIIIDYPCIIPGYAEYQPAEPTIDLSNAHIVIPTAVIRELSSFKNEEHSDRGRVARAAIKRIRELDKEEARGVDESYVMRHIIDMPDSRQTLSILPVHKDFKKALPFCPSEDDMDGQIILAALAVIFLKNKRAIDGSYEGGLLHDSASANVTLLTNDNGLTIRAREGGSGQSVTATSTPTRIRVEGM